jgi:hypothetical protein
VPLPVEAEDHVAAVPQARPEVHLFAGMKLEVEHGPRRQAVAAITQVRRFGPMLEVVRNVRDHHPLLGPHKAARRDRVRDRAAMATQIVRAIVPDEAGRLQVALAGNHVFVVVQARPAQAVGAHRGQNRCWIHFADHLKPPRRVGVLRVIEHQHNHAGRRTAVVQPD